MSARRLVSAGEARGVDARLEGRRVVLRLGDDEPVAFEIRDVGPDGWLLVEGDRLHHVLLARRGDTWWVHADGRTHVLETAAPRGAGPAPGGGSLAAPMTGTVQSVLVGVGDRVAEGEPLVVISAMKMQLEVRAPVAGTVTRLPHAAGEQVDGGTLLAVVEPDDAEESADAEPEEGAP